MLPHHVVFSFMSDVMTIGDDEDHLSGFGFRIFLHSNDVDSCVSDINLQSGDLRDACVVKSCRQGYTLG